MKQKISDLLDMIIPERVTIRELKEEMKQIDEDFINETVPKKWQPGLVYSSETKHLWDVKKGMPKPVKFPNWMSPKKTGTLKQTLIYKMIE